MQAFCLPLSVQERRSTGDLNPYIGGNVLVQVVCDPLGSRKENVKFHPSELYAVYE
jgi:hypothetical protein